MGKQLQLSFGPENQASPHAKTLHDLAHLPERELVPYVIALGITTAEDLVRQLRESEFSESGERSNYYSNIAEIAGRNRSYYIELTQRIANGSAADYKEAISQQRAELTSTSLREEFQKVVSQKSKPR